MSEEIECKTESDKFENLECLITEYYKLVQENKDGLPPYATFKNYLVDNADDSKNICINRPMKIKELVDKLDNKKEKLDAILELWATGGDIYISDSENTYNSPKLIHSMSNKSRIQVCLKGSIDRTDGKKVIGTIVNKNNLLKFASAISEYIKSFHKEDSTFKDIVEEHELIKDASFKDLLNNNIDAAINELLFWYYYDEDKYPIINSRARNSRKILNKALDKTMDDDVKFNKECMEQITNTATYINEIKISKQLMLDQLFYTIDEMKSMKKTDAEYKDDKNDKVYLFYQKLWNTIKEAKMNKELQQEYDIWCKYGLDQNKRWYADFKKLVDILQSLKEWATNQKEDFTYEKLNIEFKNKLNNKKSEGFLQKYLFEKYNGIASGGQGLIGKENGDRKKIKEHENLDTLIYEILTLSNIEDTNKKIEELIGENYHLIKNRFLLALFPENFTAIASKDDLNKLIKLLKEKFKMNLESKDYIEQNNELMSISLKDDGKEESDVYKKQIFYWWLYERLNDNLDLKKAIVYYGAPGTGKTYKAKKVAKQFMHTWSIKNGGSYSEDGKAYDLQQFHPSFSYEDFIEGIRPNKEKELKLQDGVFKKFCKKEGKIEIELWKNKAFRDKYQKINNFSKIKVSDVLKMNNMNVQEILNISKKNENKYKDLTLADIIKPAFFIIDEINRADLSRVFGELMYSLEYRGYEGKIKTQYSYLVKKGDDAEFFFEGNDNYFFIPQNIYIIGTMNTIDRSVDSFDFALRRRFSWEEIEPDYEVIKEILSPKIADKIAASLEALNTEITKNPLLGSDYQIGHSYALNLENQDLTTVKEARDFLWKNFIEPLLQEYFRGLGDSKSNLDTLKDKFY